jgi:protoheme IX farnesyltransferase
MTIMRRFLYVAYRQKDKGTALQIILYTVWLILASSSCFLFTRGLFITPVAAVVVLLGLWMLFYAVKLYKVRTQKLLGLMLVSVSYITLLLVYIFDKFFKIVMDTIMTTEEQNQNSTIIQVDFVVCYG